MNTSPPIDSICKSIDNFINICENTTTDLSRYRDKLNRILNDLNCIDFKCVQSLMVNQRTKDVLRVLLKIPLAEDTIIVKCSRLIVQLMNKTSIQTTIELFRQALLYLIAFIKQHKFVGICDALRLMQALIKNQFKNEDVSIADASAELQQSIYLLLELINDPDAMEKTISCHYDGYSINEIKSSGIFCLESILSCLDKIPLISEHEDIMVSITEVLLKLIYSLRLDETTNQSYCVVMRAALSSCRFIGFSNKEWCTKYIGDLLGACVACMLFGLPDFLYQMPQRMQSSQQSVQDTPTTAAMTAKKGGKMIKGRKPRPTPQYKNRKHLKTNENINNGLKGDGTDAAYTHSILFDSPSNKFVVTTFTTSESDTSDSESFRASNNRENETKLRLAALSLIAVIAKNVEKKTLFGYWHCLFPTDDLTSTTVALINCVLRDSNQRCRITALQATSVILYGTKSFLMQAETTDKPPTSYIPFSILLGNRVRVLYTTLTKALAIESSLPVLTQILKCLAVLIQSTSFQKLQKPSGFIRKLVTLIRRLVHHKDSTIKVAALIVMEFLIARNDITCEISDCVGLFRLEPVLNNRIHDFGEDEVIDAEENLVNYEQEYDEDEQVTDQLKVSRQDESKPNISWLLQVVLENLGVTVCSYIKPVQSAESVQVRHQSIQIILMMAPHFVWIKSHLVLISQGLETTLHDDVVTVRQRAARCLDIVSHSISTYLLSKSGSKNSDFEEDIETALLFWSKMLLSVTEQLQDLKQNSISKSIFCDVCSNIGVHVYERLPREKQIVIISLLSGLSLGDDEAIVRASAARALAIFVLFPSLKEDICFIENTTDAVLKIIHDDSLLVRTKASWAMANITDALVMNIHDPSIEQISTDLLMRIFEVTKLARNDNDKVRTNVARILGNLLRLITQKHIKHTKWQICCLDAIKQLVDQAKLTGSNANMKVKWNACYAIGNFMKNTVLFELDSKAFYWQELVFQTLAEIIVKCSNFKVRINAAAALAVPVKRSHYSKHYLNIWSALSVALYQANSLTDYNEYNHRDNLLDQLCITISHLIQLATLDDILDIENIQLQHIDSNKLNWIRVINRMVPEKAASLLAANLYLKKMIGNEDLTNEQRTAVQTLLSCFVSITEYDD